MNADDKSKLKAYEELIGSLEHTNGLQHRVIETQSSLIKSLEAVSYTHLDVYKRQIWN